MLILVAFLGSYLDRNHMVTSLFQNLLRDGYVNNGFMLLSPMVLVTVGVIIWIQRARNRKLIEKG